MKTQTGLLRSLLILLLAVSAASAVPVTVLDPSFENDLYSGNPLTVGQYTAGRLSNPVCTGAITPIENPCIAFTGNGGAWQITDNQGDSNGVLRPTTSQFASIPDGNNVAYSNGTPFFQILSATLLPNTIYNLRAFAGERLDLSNQGYFMELAADTGGGWGARAPLVRTTYQGGPGRTNLPGFTSLNAPDAIDPGFGNFIPLSVFFTTSASTPNLGRPLIISFGSAAVQAAFDNVSLDASPLAASAPEPGSIALLAAGLGLLALKRRR